MESLIKNVGEIDYEPEKCMYTILKYTNSELQLHLFTNIFILTNCYVI